jgi:SAM-dependent methyltransferase
METAYKGIEIRAAGNIHAEMASRLVSTVPSGTVVLELASGNGALAARLIDRGFSMICTDGDPAKFELDEPKCFEVDYNTAFAETITEEIGPGPYPVIVAVEVIEHLENPAAFLRECAQLLAPDGRLIVTSPNLQSAATRVRIFTRGMPAWFSPEEARGEHHVTPLLSWFMVEHARSAALEVADEWCTDPKIVTTWADGWKTKLLYSPWVLRYMERFWGAEGGDIRSFELRHGDTRESARYWDR